MTLTDPLPTAMRSWSSALAPAAIMSLCGRSSVVSFRQFCWDASATSRRSKAALVVSTADYPAVRRRWRSKASSAAFLGGASAARHADRRQQQRRSSTIVRRPSLLAADIIDVWRDHHSPQRFPRACPGLRVGPRSNLSLFESKRRSSTVRSAGGTNGDTYTGEYGRTDENLLLDNVLASWPSALSPDGPDKISNGSGGICNGMSLAEITEQAASWLRLHDVVDPEPSASELLAKAIGFRSPQEMLARQQQQQRGMQGGEATKLSRLQREEFRRLCALRAAQHMPVQYLVGEWDFYGLSLEMQPPTLIPRPETEELVEIVLRWLRQDGIASAADHFAAASTAVNADHSSGARSLRFLDVGSGTGAIGLALLNELPAETTRCVAIDAQESAVRLSRRNAQRTGLQARYSCFHAGVAEFGTISAPAEESGTETRSSSDPSRGISDRGGEKGEGEGGDDLDFGGGFDFIVSNPPYIPRKDMEVLPRDVADHEDSIALDGGEDGLDIVREIIRRCPGLLRKGGPRQLWMEVDTSHPEALQRWLGLEVGLGEGAGESQECESHGVTRFAWMPDMSQRPRFVRLTFAEEDAESK